MTHEEIDVMAAGTALDWLLAEKVMGWVCLDSITFRTNHPHWKPSVDLDTAVETCADFWWRIAGQGEPLRIYSAEIEGAGGRVFHADADAPALALCRARLKAATP